MTAPPVVCRCGRVAEDADLECSLCGRDLSLLRTPAPELQRIDGGATMRTRPPHSDAYSEGGQETSTYAAPHGRAGESGPTQASAWKSPLDDPPDGAAGSSFSRFDGLVLATIAMAIAVAGLALGYFAIAPMLQG